VSESDVWLLGARDLDPLEADALARSGVRQLDVDSIDAGLGDLVRRELTGAARLHIHLDLDVLDPRDGRTNEYAAPDGVRRDALIAACGALGAAGPAALTLSAYDPTFDEDGRVAALAGEVAVALLDGLATPATT
jgi:arginase